MTSAITTAATTVPATSASSTQAIGSYDYKANATLGVVATAICTFFNPISGAAIGTYFVTDIAANALGDMLGLDQAGTIGKIVKAAAAFFIAVGAAFGTLTALGVTVSLTPGLIGALIGVSAMRVLYQIGDSCP